MSDLKPITRPELEKIITDALERRSLLATRLKLEGIAPQQASRIPNRMMSEDALDAYVNEAKRHIEETKE